MIGTSGNLQSIGLDQSLEKLNALEILKIRPKFCEEQKKVLNYIALRINSKSTSSLSLKN